MEEDFDIPGGEEMDLGEDKVGEEREIGSRGLKKKLLKEGQGWETPEVGDEVQVPEIATTPIPRSFSRMS